MVEFGTRHFHVITFVETNIDGSRKSILNRVYMGSREKTIGKIMHEITPDSNVAYAQCVLLS